MGAIARNIANNITTSGVFTSSAIANSSVTGITVLANASDGITLISSNCFSFCKYFFYNWNKLNL